MTIILRIAVLSPLWQSFDYLPMPGNYHWAPGMRVLVPFGRRQLVGVILELDDKAQVALDKLKVILDVLDPLPILPENILRLSQFASDYYHFPIGEVVVGSLPKLLREGRELGLNDCEVQENLHQPQNLNPQIPELNAEQQQAVDAIVKAKDFQAFVLDGVTGSGKTEVYLQVIAEKLKAGQQALVLVPEISLTPQTLERFSERFHENIAVLHSGLTDKQRMQAWLQAASGQAKVVIGTRSAIFTPMPELAVIILDEEHDPSFKQQTGFRYSARDLAVVRAHHAKIPLVLGSATPSLETLYNVQRNRYQSLRLTERAGIAKPPKIHIIDLCKQDMQTGISADLNHKILEHLNQKGQVLLFLNRRGYAPILMCHHCGLMIECERCDARMTLHLEPRYLFCHHCDIVKPPPRICPHCHQSELILLGMGTERVEETLKQQFPLHNVIRIDRDSTRKKGSMQKLLQQMHSGEANILVGTQMISKGHHFSNLSLVAVIDADAGLFSTDFRATERLAQMLTQVSGRAGREGQEGEVVIQTHQPDHPLLNLLLQQGYHAFAESVLKERQSARLPPYSHLALLRADAKLRDDSLNFLKAAKAHLLKEGIGPIKVLGPVPAVMERKADRYHAQLLLQSSKRPELQHVLIPFIKSLSGLEAAKKVRWSLDIDPQDMY